MDYSKKKKIVMSRMIQIEIKNSSHIFWKYQNLKFYEIR